MGLFQILAKKVGVGLDLGNRWIKTVRLIKDGKRLKLSRVGRTFLKKEELEDKNKLREKIKKFLNSLLIKDRELSLSLAGHSVIIKRLKLPKTEQKKEKLEETIKKHAKEHIPFDIENVFMDYFILTPEGNTEDIEYFLVASKKNVVNELKDFIESANFRIEGIDVEGFALCNCFEYNYPEFISDTAYLLDIGSVNSVFCVYSKGSPLLIRDLSLGGDQITNLVKEVLNANFSECEKIKINGFKGVVPKEKILIYQKMEELYLNWIDEIQKILYFYTSNNPEAQEVGKIYLSGGGSLAPKLKEVMEEHLEKNIDILNPFRKIDIPISNFDTEYLKATGPQFAIATGLALRNFI